MHGNEQKPDMRVGRKVAEALEHAIAVVIRKRQFGRGGDANETRRAALERTVRTSGAVGGRNEEVAAVFDKALVVVAERCARQFFQTVGEPPAIKLVLKCAAAFVIKHACHVASVARSKNILQALRKAGANSPAFQK